MEDKAPAPEDGSPVVADLTQLLGRDGGIFHRLASARKNGEPLVVAQLGQSLDGRIATPNGHSHYINGRAALTLLHHLRARCDAVVVGAGTAIADDPALTVRRAKGDNPARVLLDRTRRAGSACRLLMDDGVPRVVFGNPLADDPQHITYVDRCGGEGALLDPHFIVRRLVELGHHRVLVEGGAATVSAFLQAGALDVLCFFIGPMIVGAGPTGINLDAIDHLDGALRPDVSSCCLADGDLFLECRFAAQRSDRV